MKKTLILLLSVYATFWIQEYRQFDPYQIPTQTFQYNPFQDQWQRTAPGDTLRYNPFDNGWQFQPKGYEYKYNPFNNKWE